eukprot:15476234-Alexandrium_andersonii.AAC.1
MAAPRVRLRAGVCVCVCVHVCVGVGVCVGGCVRCVSILSVWVSLTVCVCCGLLPDPCAD